MISISAISDLLLSQPQAKILVGDPHQQIYSFRGAVNALQQIRASFIFYLTQVRQPGNTQGPVSQKGLRPGASLVRTKSGPKPQNQTKFRIFIKKIYMYMQYDTCKNYLVCMLTAFCFYPDRGYHFKKPEKKIVIKWQINVFKNTLIL